MYLALSWRNIWRNKNRTLIAAASVFFGVLMAVLMRSSQEGSYSYMIHSSAKLFTGYLQLQGKGYWDNRSLDKSIHITPDQLQAIATIPNIINFTRRLETFTLMSFETNTKVTQVIGIDPKAEHDITGLKSRLTKGAYLSDNDDGILLGEGLAKRLKVAVGEKVVLYGQGYHGQIAAAELPVVGLVKLPFIEMDNSSAYLVLDNAQTIFSMPNLITSLPIMVDHIKHLQTVKSALSAMINDGTTLMTWDEMMPEMAQHIVIDNASGIIMIVILYIVIVFGVFGTVMMMVSERSREFAILISVGMKKWRLILVTTLESIFVAFVGMLAGVVASLPIVLYLYYNPIRVTGEMAKSFDDLGIEAIITFSRNPELFINQALVVLVIALTSALYSVVFISKLEPAVAIRA